jgi:hypothetical protein
VAFRTDGVEGGMPKRSDNAGVETEKGFGTGLRTKLEKRRPGPAEEPAEAESPIAEAEAEAELDSEPAVEQEIEPSETEQLWAELEESLAREEALKRQLEDQANAHSETRELGRRLADRAEELKEREDELEARFKELERPAAEPAAPEHGRAYLRRRIEEDGEALWRVFQESLTATKTNGQPDFRIRLMAASTLLAEAYGDTTLLSPGEQVAAARDELAGMRAKRASTPKKR